MPAAAAAVPAESVHPGAHTWKLCRNSSNTFAYEPGTILHPTVHTVLEESQGLFHTLQSTQHYRRTSNCFALRSQDSRANDCFTFNISSSDSMPRMGPASHPVEQEVKETVVRSAEGCAHHILLSRRRRSGPVWGQQSCVSVAGAPCKQRAAR